MLVHGKGVGEMYSVVLDRVYEESRAIKCPTQRTQYVDEFQHSIRTGTLANLHEWYAAYCSSSKYKGKRRIS